jgi:PEP-CTERM motif
MKRNRDRRVVCAAFAALTLLVASDAGALPLVGDQTIVLLTSEPTLSGLGIVIDPLGDADIAEDIAGRLDALFPITGGDLTGIVGTIEHAGSGLLLSDGVNDLALENFLIDTTTLQLFADVSVNDVLSGNAPLMDVDFCTTLAGTPDACIDGDGSELLDGFKLTLNGQAASTLAAVFGLPDLTGTQFGVARIDVRVIPEPSTVLLVGIGLAVAAARRGRHARS